MNTRNESAKSHPAMRRVTLRNCLLAVVNALVVAAGIYSACSLAVSHHAWASTTEAQHEIVLYKADRTASAPVCTTS
ncbi:hypothetical protein [Variovorax sp. Sphag1AA]|uniref:hypothetical protein n=1 Tax=Variovorax sp. Sphag1AA TaxID=2587027 RepID=UPI001619F96C|nr:hypothetical protein [Variovorax sp. Sphag1AA]MBB3178264.1 hypothetical protein [Variovorax sp. Sphag1AA]